MLQLWIFGADGLVTRWEQFDREPEALARFDELTAPQAPARRVRPNAATALLDRMTAVHAARDLAAFAQLSADGMIVVHHPTRVEFGRDAGLARFEALYRAEDLVIGNELLATLGDSLALSRTSTSVSALADYDVDFGAIRIETHVVTEVDAHGRYRRVEIFADDHLADAIARLYERYAELLPEGPERSRAAMTARAVAALLPTDFDAIAAVLAPDVAFADRRVLGMGSLRGAENYLRGLRSLTDVARDRFAITDGIIAATPDALLVLRTSGGIERSGGGAFDHHYLILWVFGADGHVTQIERFDADCHADALTRLDALTGAAPEPRFANAAWRRAERIAHLTMERNWDAVVALYAPDFVLDDRRSIVGITVSGEAFLAHLRMLFDARRESSCELLATRGERLVLFRMRITSAVRHGGSAEWEMLTVSEVDHASRRVANVTFDPDDLDAAYAELDRRYAEGEGARHATLLGALRDFARAWREYDRDALERLLAPGFTATSHRRFPSSGEVFDRRAWLALRAADGDLGLQDETFRWDHLRISPTAVLRAVIWTGTRDGGAFEIPFVMVDAHDGARLLSQDGYDPDQLDAAFARFDELSREAASGPRFENVATRWMGRYQAEKNAGDTARLSALHAPGFAMDDRRGHVQLELNREQALLLPDGAYEWRYTWEPVATRGDRLALVRALNAFRTDLVGPSEIEWLSIVEVNEAGQRTLGILFDPDDLDTAYAELDARYHAGEAAPYPNVAAGMREFSRAFAARDWDALAARCAPDLAVHDHRLLGWETLHGPAAYVRALRALVDLAPDTALRLDHVEMREQGYLVVTVWSGSCDGGAFEEPSLMVAELDDAGRIRRFDAYDLERQGAARARFAEVASVAERDPLRIPPNAATRAMDRFGEAVVARDWDALANLLAPEFHFDDRRRGILDRGDRAKMLASVRLAATAGATTTAETLATTGERLALQRIHFSGSEGDRLLWEIDTLQIVEIDAEGRIVMTVTFDPDDRRAASLEMRDRYFLGEGARSTPAAMIAFATAANDHDAAGMRATLPDDFFFHDHRRTGVGRLESASEYIASHAALWELAPDMMLDTLYYVAAAEHASLAVARIFGTLADGGAFESIAAQINWYENGRVVGIELFEPEDLDRARALFESRRRDPLRIPPNAATRAGERFRDFALAADWDAIRKLVAPIAFEDRRPLVRTNGGCEMIVANTQTIPRSVWERSTRTLLATVGDRLALHLNQWRGDEAAGAFEIDGLEITEVDADGRIVAAIVFDPADRRAASREMSDRYLRSDEAPRVAATGLASMRALLDHDLEALAASLPDDFFVEDHRRFGMGRVEGVAAFVQSFAALFEQAGDLVLEGLYTVSAREHGILEVAHMFGTLDASGGDFDSVYVRLFVFRDDRFVGFELFEVEDLDAARARFEALRGNLA